MKANRKKFELKAMESRERGPYLRASRASAVTEKPSNSVGQQRDPLLLSHYKGGLQRNAANITGTVGPNRNRQAMNPADRICDPRIKSGRVYRSAVSEAEKYWISAMDQEYVSFSRTWAEQIGGRLIGFE